MAIGRNSKEILNYHKAIITFNKKTSLKQILGMNIITKIKLRTTKGNHLPYHKYLSLHFQKEISVTSCFSIETETFYINHELKSKRDTSAIYLNESFSKCNAIRKSETPLCSRLTNHRKQIKVLNITDTYRVWYILKEVGNFIMKAFQRDQSYFHNNTKAKTKTKTKPLGLT